MLEEIMEYERYLLHFRMVNKPPMPNFDLFAYTESEYTSAVFGLLQDFDLVDDEWLTIMHLKGE